MAKCVRATGIAVEKQYYTSGSTATVLIPDCYYRTELVRWDVSPHDPSGHH